MPIENRGERVETDDNTHEKKLLWQPWNLCASEWFWWPKMVQVWATVASGNHKRVRQTLCDKDKGLIVLRLCHKDYYVKEIQKKTHILF
jgi:hypothetical protein